MDSEQFLDERIQVIATFSGGLNPCFPRRFKRANGRMVEVTRIGLYHPTKAGRRTVHVFDVTDESADYRLILDSERLTWRLVLEADHVA